VLAQGFCGMTGVSQQHPAMHAAAATNIDCSDSSTKIRSGKQLVQLAVSMLVLFLMAASCLPAMAPCGSKPTSTQVSSILFLAHAPFVGPQAGQPHGAGMAALGK